MRPCRARSCARFADPWVDFEHSGLEKIKAEPEHEVYKITDEQLTEWKKSAEPLKQKWAADVKKTGSDPDAIWKDLQGSLAQYNAGF
jgi:TRAP-type transport system periplasmic protein